MRHSTSSVVIVLSLKGGLVSSTTTTRQRGGHGTRFLRRGYGGGGGAHYVVLHKPSRAHTTPARCLVRSEASSRRGGYWLARRVVRKTRHPAFKASRP